jgi:hypothetical protein
MPNSLLKRQLGITRGAAGKGAVGVILCVGPDRRADGGVLYRDLGLVYGHRMATVAKLAAKGCKVTKVNSISDEFLACVESGRSPRRDRN